MSLGRLLPKRQYLGALSLLNFYFYSSNCVKWLSRNAGYYVEERLSVSIQMLPLGQKGHRVFEITNLRFGFTWAQLRRIPHCPETQAKI
jgi:hypothetical protein